MRQSLAGRRPRLIVVRSEDATGVGRDVGIAVRSDSGNEARAR